MLKTIKKRNLKVVIQAACRMLTPGIIVIVGFFKLFFIFGAANETLSRKIGVYCASYCRIGQSGDCSN